MHPRARALALRAAAKVTLLFAVADCVDDADRALYVPPDASAADAPGADVEIPDADAAIPDADDGDDASPAPSGDAGSLDAATCGFCDPPDAAFGALGCDVAPLPLTGAGASLLEGAPIACCIAAVAPHIVSDPGGQSDRLDAAALVDPGIYACCTLIVAWVGNGGVGVTADLDAACCTELGSPTIQGCSPWGPPMPPAWA